LAVGGPTKSGKPHPSAKSGEVHPRQPWSKSSLAQLDLAGDHQPSPRGRRRKKRKKKIKEQKN